ncbi:polysialyltransferase family glycosyltransferase [Streptomyces sp. NPDC001744]|uniref:polysialyltransferase family glycosyltransferase n=1 Tax=Streptomyces sp. NPDC001744 TaxID=3364606 RepID=UPI0036A27C3A
MSPRRTTQIFCASTLYGVVTLAAAIDSGRFGSADRRLLLVTNNAPVPETTPAPDEAEGFARLRDRFDSVLSWNEVISPLHPGGWTPRASDLPLLQRHLRTLWDLGDDRVELALESIQVTPALAVAQLLPEASITVYADGLMSYGPTRNRIDPLIGGRVSRLLHLDLVPGLAPLLLGEFGAVPETVPTEAFTRCVEELAGPPAPGTVPEEGGGPALLLGQYLAALNLLTAAEEEELHLRMVRGAVARGHRRLVFKPHPTAPDSWSRALVRAAEELGAELTVEDRPVLAEVLYRELRPALVVGCFSTALLTARTFYGLPVARVGTRALLERLAPFQNSNRVPLTVVDAVVPPLFDDGPEGGGGIGTEELNDLVAAVGYAMQPKIRPELREAAVRHLSGPLAGRTRHHFGLRRLTVLNLPGGLPLPRHPKVRRLARRALRLRRTLKR